eukprot:5142105-Amphidinium_carterae.1
MGTPVTNTAHVLHTKTNLKPEVISKTRVMRKNGWHWLVMLSLLLLAMWVETNLPEIAEGTQVRTRGEYNVRLSPLPTQRRTSPHASDRNQCLNLLVRSYTRATSSWLHLAGTTETPLWHKPPKDAADDGPLAHIKIGYSSSAVYVNKWKVAYVSTRGETLLHFDKSWPSGVPCEGLAASLAHRVGNPIVTPGVLRISSLSTEPPNVRDILLEDCWRDLGDGGLLPRVATWNAASLFSRDCHLY